MATGSTWLVSQLRHIDALTVVSVQNADKGSFVDISLRNTENKIVGAFTIEILMIYQLWFAIGIEQLDAIDELKVGSIHCDQVATSGSLACLL